MGSFESNALPTIVTPGIDASKNIYIYSDVNKV